MTRKKESCHLPKITRTKQKETEKPSVVINGDSVANLGVTIQVMQIIKQLGATPVVAVDPSHE